MTQEKKLPSPNEREERFQLLIDSVEDYAIYMLDKSGHVMTWNRGAEANKGYTSEEILGKPFRMFFVPEDVAAGAPEIELAAAAETGRFAGEGWRLHKNGRRFWASFTLTAIRNPAGELLGFAKVARDLSERKRHEDELRALGAALQVERDQLQEERDRFYAAAESSLDALFICKSNRDEAGEIEDFSLTYLNSNVETMVGLPRGELLGRGLCEKLPFMRTTGLFELYKQVVQTGEPLVYEFPVEDRAVTTAWLRIQAVRLRDGIVITASDITARKLAEARMLHMAEHDALTGLPNRTVMKDRAEQAMKRARREQTRVGVLIVDLDGFKQINDSLGHRAGDTVLFQLANRLRESVRASDSVIRIGGDEFVVLVPEVKQMRDLEALSRKLCENLGQPMEVDGHILVAKCSIGIAAYPDHGNDFEDLLSRADAAMYAVKRRGNHQVEIHSSQPPPQEDSWASTGSS